MGTPEREEELLDKAKVFIDVIDDGGMYVVDDFRCKIHGRDVDVHCDYPVEVTIRVTASGFDRFHDLGTVTINCERYFEQRWLDAAENEIENAPTYNVNEDGSYNVCYEFGPNEFDALAEEIGYCPEEFFVSGRSPIDDLMLGNFGALRNRGIYTVWDMLNLDDASRY